MRYLNYAKCETWLSQSDMRISSSRDLLLPEELSREQKSYFAPFPRNGFDLTHISGALANWIEPSEERMLWLKNWETTPPFEMEFFEFARGSNVHLIDAPGHLFGNDVEIGNRDGCGRDTAVIGGLLLLVMCYDWEAYLVGRGRTEYVYVSDGHVWISSSEAENLERGLTIFRSFELNVKIGARHS